MAGTGHFAARGLLLLGQAHDIFHAQGVSHGFDIAMGVYMWCVCVSFLRTFCWLALRETKRKNVAPFFWGGGFYFER